MEIATIHHSPRACKVAASPTGFTPLELEARIAVDPDAAAPADYPSAPTLARWEKKAPATAPADFVPLHLEIRTHVSTAVMCRHIGRQPQTARGWASAETYPEGLKPIRLMGRLAWPVAGIKAALGVG